MWLGKNESVLRGRSYDFLSNLIFFVSKSPTLYYQRIMTKSNILHLLGILLGVTAFVLFVVKISTQNACMPFSEAESQLLQHLNETDSILTNGFTIVSKGDSTNLRLGEVINCSNETCINFLRLGEVVRGNLITDYTFSPLFFSIPKNHTKFLKLIFQLPSVPVEATFIKCIKYSGLLNLVFFFGN